MISFEEKVVGAVITVDEDGVVKGQNMLTKTVKVKDNDEFCFLYKKHLGFILELTRPAMSVLWWCSVNAALHSNEVYLLKSTKQRIADGAKISLGAVANAITELIKRNMLVRVATGVYMVNPETTWKGSVSDKPKNVGLFINYSIAAGDAEQQVAGLTVLDESYD